MVVGFDAPDSESHDSGQGVARFEIADGDPLPLPRFVNEGVVEIVGSCAWDDRALWGDGEMFHGHYEAQPHVPGGAVSPVAERPACGYEISTAVWAFWQKGDRWEIVVVVIHQRVLA